MRIFLKWAAGMLEDQQGSASSKRVGFYWAFLLLTYMIIKSTNGATVNAEQFWAVFTIILVGYGLITSEYFKTRSIQSGKSEAEPDPEKPA